jgi:G patch domain/KOW motif-containing protein
MEPQEKETTMSSAAVPPPTTGKLSLTLKKKKPKTAAAVAPEFEAPGVTTGLDAASYRRDTDVPLVIPVGENKLKFHKKPNTVMEEPASNGGLPLKGTSMASDDAAALEALQREASNGAGGTGATKNRNLVIQGNDNTFQGSSNKNDNRNHETQQYKADLEALPDELPTDSESFQRVPIAEFGAALLRGMGWSGGDDSNDKKKKDDDAASMPRPHRLGLGAIPKMDESMLPPSSSSRRRALRPDQLKRQEALEQQQQEYAKQRNEQVANDKQRTLQNQSLVHITNGKRAKILQLVGVPGLSMVKIQYEDETGASIVKRREIGDLLSREELDKKPYRSVELEVVGEQKGKREEKEKSRDHSRRSESDSRHREEKDSKGSSRRDDTHHDRSRNDRKRDRDSDKTRSSRETEERQSSRSSRDTDERQPSSKRHRDEPSNPPWVIPNIRVRVITEKLGRRYYKEKAIVIDVTPKGATLEMANGSVLDRVPERYLETALPKQGGKAVVLVGNHRFAKGRLLERDSRRSTGVIQVFEDMNVLTLSMDDMAEWCGPLDDDLDV